MYKTIEAVSKSIEKAALLESGQKVLVALSGGADSVCLLLILHELGYEVLPVHCNFHLRGEESMRDERFVRALCSELGIRIVVKDFDTVQYAEEKRQSIELAARDLRYDFFSDVMKEEGVDVLAVGHHMDDNAETFLLNATRKSGVRGLSGMKLSTVNKQGCRVIRPLLCLRHGEIEAFLRERGQEWVVDSTNRENDAARNKIRNLVIPVLEEVNKAAVGNICKTMENLTEIMAIYEVEMERCKARCVKKSEGAIVIDRKMLMGCTSPISVLHEILSPLGFNSTQIQNLLTAKGYRCNRPKGAKEITLPGGRGKVMVDISWDKIIVSL